MKLIEITTKGEINTIDLDEKNFLKNCYDVIGCQLIEFPPCQRLPWPYKMIVDESGLLKEDPEPNMIGWWLYSCGHPDYPIVGTALIAKQQGEDIVGLSDDELETMTDYLIQIGIPIKLAQLGGLDHGRI